jgi:GPH family glycoside/pentoside/hexuronide:cation symporter
MGVMAAMGVLLFLFCFTTRSACARGQAQSLLAQFRLLLKNDQWLMLCGVCVTGTVGYVLRGSVAIYYAKYYLGGDVPCSPFLSPAWWRPSCPWWRRPGSPSSIARSSCSAGPRSLVFVISAAIYFWSSRAMWLLAFVLYFCCPSWWTCMRRCSGRPSPRPSITVVVKTGKRVSGFAFGGISCARRPAWHRRHRGGQAAGVFRLCAQPVADAIRHDGIVLMLTVIPGFFHPSWAC